MTLHRFKKFRDDETWERVRRAWEGGETAASCARRFDVGLANLWRRRAAEGWERDRPEDPTPEPVEGWERYAQDQVDWFERRLRDGRALARNLAQSMAGGPVEDVPLWHLGFVLAWRAEHLGAEVAAGDRERNREQPWASAIWGEGGAMKMLATMDRGIVVLHREEWRKEAGLPEGVAVLWP